MLGTIAAVAGLAFLDSLNPFSIAAMAVVIAKQHSLTRGFVFIVGTFVAYFSGGMLILNGWVITLKALLPFVTPMIATIGWIVGGLIAIGGAIYLWAKGPSSSEGASSKATPAALLGIFGFALISTASDLPTAIPLFGAIPLILATKPSILGVIAWLSFYCFIYVGPLCLLLGLKLLGDERLEPMLLKINKGMDWIMGKLLPPLLGLTGIWCFFSARPT